MPNVVWTEQKEHLCGQLRDVIMKVIGLPASVYVAGDKSLKSGKGSSSMA